MYKDKSVGVVVPAYNEERFIGTVIDTMPTFVDRIYVVDDCSTDGTWRAITTRVRHESAKAPATPALADGGIVTDGRLVPIRHEENRGVGGAIKTGYLRAAEDGMDITAVMGGDGQMDPDVLERIVDPIAEDAADYVKGNRLLYRTHREGMTGWRFLGNSVLTFLTKIASGYWKTMDPQNGYTAISRTALDTIGIEAMYEGYGYCNDLLVKLNARGMRVADVALPAVYGEETSTIAYPSYIWNVSGMLLRNFLWRLKTKYLLFDFHPLALFYYFGAFNAGVGLFGLCYAVLALFLDNGSFFIRGTLALIVFTMGSLFLMFAMLFDMQANERLEVQIRD